MFLLVSPGIMGCTDTLTQRLDSLLHSLFQNEALARMDNIDDRTRPDRFEILQKHSGMSTIR
jgi:hypothetical protein